MKKLNQKEWLGVAAALVVIAIFFLSRSFVFSFFTQNILPTEPAESSDFTSQSQITENILTNNTNGTEGGLQAEDIVVGTGAVAVPGQTITVHYVGKLENGLVFDSSYGRGQPYSFPLGVGEVIRGWDIGVAGMKVGGKRVLVIPADLAYGSQARGAIPANSTLIFEVDLIAVQ